MPEPESPDIPAEGTCLHVVHITRDFPQADGTGGCGGLSTGVYSLVEALTEAGVGNTVLSFDGWRPGRRVHEGSPGPPARPAPPDHPGEPDSEHLRIPVRRWRGRQTPAPETLRRLAAVAGADLLHIHDPLLWSLLSGGVDPAWPPRLYHAHIIHSEVARHRRLHAAESSSSAGIATRPTAAEAGEAVAIREADSVLVPGSHAKAWLGSAFPAARKKITQATLSIQAKSLQKNDKWPTRNCLENRPPGLAVDRARDTRRPNILYLGRFADDKGFGDWLEAVDILRDRFGRDALEFTFAGGLPHNRRAERRWQTRIAALDIHARTPGWLSPSARTRELAEASALILPSRLETQSLVALEAMAAECPLIATRCGGPEEVLTHMETALLCTPGRPDALAEAVSRVLTEPGLASQLARQANRQFRERCNWESRLPPILLCYRRLRQEPATP